MFEQYIPIWFREICYFCEHYKIKSKPYNTNYGKCLMKGHLVDECFTCENWSLHNKFKGKKVEI